MQAVSIVHSVPSARKSYTLSQASLALGIHPNTCRRYCDSGLIGCTVLPSGHRRLTQRDLDAFNGILEDDAAKESVGGKGIAVYARVSDVSQNSKGQDGKSSLERQIGRLLEETSKREGIDQGDIRLFKDVASSFGDREGLNKLVDTIIDGTTKKVYCLYLDRLSRIPALTRLIEHLCKRFGVEIIALDVEDCEGQEVWQKELLGYITVWCNRQSAQKSVAVTKRELSPECIRRMIELRQKGLTAKKVWRALTKEGWKAKTGIGQEYPISYMAVRQCLDANGGESILTKVIIGQEATIDKSCKDFIEACLKQDEYSCKVSIPLIWDSYCLFCQKQNKEPQPKELLGKALAKVFGKYNTKSQGIRYWRGLKLVD